MIAALPSRSYPAESVVGVWAADMSNLTVSKWAFRDYVPDPPEQRVVTLFKLKNQLGSITNMRRSVQSVLDQARAAEAPQHLMGISAQYAIFCEEKKQWYILHMETAGEKTFRICEANMVFDDYLAYSATPARGSENELTSAIAKLIEKKEREGE